MTAVPDWDIDVPRDTDADLVRGSLAGDRAAFAQIYDRYADRLHDFCVGMLRDPDGAADCVQETFYIAASRLYQLKEPDRLRPWLYAVARSEALRRLRDRRRETPAEEFPDVESDEYGPDTLSARTELADLIAEAAGGLSDRDRSVLELTFRHGLDGPDLAEALGVSHSNANTMVARLRKTVERSLGALLVSRRVRNDPNGCAELREIVANWDGEFTVLMRKRISRHIESCSVCEDDRRRLVSPAALLGAAPVFVSAPAWLREKTLGEIQLVSHDRAMADTSGGADSAGGGGETQSRRRRMMLAALLIAELGASTGLLLAHLGTTPMSVSPAEASQTAPPSAPQTPRSAGPPANPTQPPPPVVPPLDVPSPQSGSTPELAPPTPAPPPEPPSEPDEDVIATLDPPTTRPPMSFSPTAVVPSATPPDSDGGGGGRSDAPPGAASPGGP